MSAPTLVLPPMNVKILATKPLCLPRYTVRLEMSSLGDWLSLCNVGGPFDVGLPYPSVSLSFDTPSILNSGTIQDLSQ